MCSFQTPQHCCHRLGTSPTPVLLCSAASAAWMARGAEELQMPRLPGPLLQDPSSLCSCWLCPQVLSAASGGAPWLTGWHTPLVWDMAVCREPGKQGGVEVSHLQELVHSFVTRLKVHTAFLNLELLFLALVPTISPVLKTLLAGTARITSITAKHEKSCKKFIVLPM